MLMAHTRDKKWGLMQRTEYESQRTQSLSQSRQTGTDSRDTRRKDNSLDENRENEENRVTINERLKSLLFG